MRVRQMLNPYAAEDPIPGGLAVVLDGAVPRGSKTRIGGWVSRSLAALRRWGGGVLLVGDVITPRRGITLVVDLEHRDVCHEV